MRIFNQINSKEELLDYIIAVLEVADAPELENVLVMNDWITTYAQTVPTFPKNVGHFCGYEACICGYLALDSTKDKTTIDALIEKSEEAEKVMKEILGRDLTGSIVDPNAFGRWESAGETYMFTNTEMKHDHLTSESSLACAISYLKLIRSKL